MDKPIKRVRAAWREVFLVCGKCSGKLDGGFGKKGDKRLAKGLGKALAKTLGRGGKGSAGKGRKAGFGIIETGCLGICPKDAVVVLRGSAPGDWAVIPRGTPFDSILRRLAPAAPIAPAGPVPDTADRDD